LRKDKPRALAARIDSKFDNSVFAFASSHYLMYDIFFHNLSAAEEALEWMNKLEEGERQGDALQVKNNQSCKRRFE